MIKDIVRSLMRHKSSTAMNLLGLSLAFAATIILSMQVQYYLKYDQSYQEYDRIVQLSTKANKDGSEWFTGNRQTPAYLEENLPEIEAIGLFTPAWSGYYIGIKQNNGQLIGTSISLSAINEGFMKIFDIHITEGDPNTLRMPDHVIIAQSVVDEYFPTTSPIGQVIVSQKKEYVIGGVYKDFPANSTFSTQKMFRGIGDEHINKPEETSYRSFLLLKEGSDLEHFKEKIASIDGVVNKDCSMSITPLWEIHAKMEGNTTAMRILILIALLIIVVACINFFNFSMSLVPLKVKGVNIRKVMGAQNSVLQKSIIFESIFLSICAYILSIIWVFLFNSSALSDIISAEKGFEHNINIYSITLLIAIIAGFVSSINPAWVTTSFEPGLVLKGNFAMSQRGRNLRNILIGAQFFISIGLLTTTLFVHRQYSYMLSKDSGYIKEGILHIEHGWNGTNCTLLEERLRSNANIDDVTFSHLPFGATDYNQVWTKRQGEKSMNFGIIRVSYNFMDFFDIKMESGRRFRLSDEQRSSDLYILNQKAIDTYQLPDAETIHFDEGAMNVAGVCRDFNAFNLKNNIEPLAFYFSSRYDFAFTDTYIKVKGNIPNTIEFIQKSYHEINPTTPIEVKFFSDEIAQAYEKEENLSTMIALFSFIAIAIALVGVFGLVSFDTRYRRKEIAVRRVNGASIRQILQMFSFTYLKIVLISFALSTPLCYYIIKKWLQQFPYRIEIEGWGYVVSLLVISILTLIVAALQSYKAATQNPYQVIKSE